MMEVVLLVFPVAFLRCIGVPSPAVNAYVALCSSFLPPGTYARTDRARTVKIGEMLQKFLRLNRKKRKLQE